jgi:myo-inositol-1(or 4)-monophosphatase
LCAAVSDFRACVPPSYRFNFGVDLTPYRTFMAELTEQSGAFLRPLFGSLDLVVDTKADATPVTIADRGAEELLRSLIAKKFPAHGIIGEEFGAERSDAEFVWMLDPVDGTKSFIHGVPLWGTLIALLHAGQPVLGAIHLPALGHLMLGDGANTTLDGKSVSVRPCEQIEAATLLTSDPVNPGKYQNGPAFSALRSRARLVRTWGDCYGYFLLASGRADIMCDPVLSPWDLAALVPVVRGAGGVISDWQGRLPWPAQSALAASSRALHAAAVAVLNSEDGI